MGIVQVIQILENMRLSYLSHIQDEIGDCGQCSTANMNICVYFQILKSDFNLGKFQMYSVKPTEERNHGQVERENKHPLWHCMYERRRTAKGKRNVFLDKPHRKC